MNLSKYKKYSELLYNDRFTIHRYIELEDDDGSTIDGLDLSLIHIWTMDLMLMVL